MKVVLTLIVLATGLLFSTCQQYKTKNSNHSTTINPTSTTMDLSKITNETVRLAIEALQENDINKWYSYFTSNATFTDDERELNFQSFFDNAFNKKEKFLSIDKIEKNGQDIYGNFYAGQWGTFNVFFKFSLDSNNKIHRLDIGQTK